MSRAAPRRRPTRPGVVLAVATTLLAMAAPAPAVAQTNGVVHRNGSELGEIMRAKTQACWSLPAGFSTQGVGARRVVRVRFTLGRDGGLTSGPDVVNPSDDPEFKLLASSAVRAVKRCAPFKLPVASYAEWRDVIINFDPDDGL